MTSKIAAIEEINELLSEILGRMQRFQKPMYSVTGVDDFDELSRKVEKLQAEHSLPRMLEFRSLPNREVIRFKVWDPLLPASTGVIGVLTQGAEFRSMVNETNLPVVIDYLGRHKRYLSSELEKLQRALSMEASDSNTSTWDHARYFVQLFLGDASSRIPKLLITLGAGAMLSQWWLPLVHAIAIKHLEIPEKLLKPMENGSQVLGLIMLISGIAAWVWIVQRKFSSHDSSSAIGNSSAESQKCKSNPDRKLGTFKIVPEGNSSSPVGDAQSPEQAIKLARTLAERHGTPYHVYLMNSDGAFTQDLGIVRPPD